MHLRFSARKHEIELSNLIKRVLLNKTTQSSGCLEDQDLTPGLSVSGHKMVL